MKYKTKPSTDIPPSPAEGPVPDEKQQANESSVIESRVRQREEGIERTRRALRRLVQDSPHTQRTLEERSGFKRGYLSQVLKGHISLSLRHVLGILLATDRAPGPFFAELFPAPGDGDPYPGQISEIRQRMARYDSALRELEDKGLLAPEDAPSPDDSKR